MIDETWEKFQLTNMTHDFARWLLSLENGQIKQVTFFMEDGSEIGLDSRKHRRFMAFKKMIAKTTADQ